MFIPPIIIHFVVMFSFVLGLTYIATTVMAFFICKEELPSIKFILINNIISAFMISGSITTTIHYLPNLYKEMKVNNGLIQLSDKDGWINNVDIEANSMTIKYNLCGKHYTTQNTMFNFYESLNSNLIKCNLKDNSLVHIDIISNPFKNLDEKVSNSVIKSIQNKI